MTVVVPIKKMSPGLCVETLVTGSDTSFAKGSVQVIERNWGCPLSNVSSMFDGQPITNGGVVSTVAKKRKEKT